MHRTDNEELLHAGASTKLTVRSTCPSARKKMANFNHATACWVDIGASHHSGFESDLLLNPNLAVIAVEPTPTYAASLLRRNISDRFQVVQRACTSRSTPYTHMHVHMLKECSSLQTTTPGHPNVLNGLCLGGREAKMKVETISLEGLLALIPQAPPPTTTHTHTTPPTLALHSTPLSYHPPASSA